jgi:hypothetical protein
LRRRARQQRKDSLLTSALHLITNVASVSAARARNDVLLEDINAAEIDRFHEQIIVLSGLF